MSGHDLSELSDRVGPCPGNTPQEATAAAWCVCAHARDADDARVILRALGLLP